MRVLHFFKTYWPDSFGGIERTIHSLAMHGAKLDIETTVLSLSTDPEKNSIDFDGHRAEKSKLDFELASTGFSWSVFHKFKKLSDQVDIIHYHFPWPFMDLVHHIVRPKTPFVITYHSDIVKQRTLSRLYAPLMHSFLNKSASIIATSPKYVHSSSVLNKYSNKISVIPIGLDRNSYPKPSQADLSIWKERFKRPFFLFVGVLRYYKGLDYLVEAAAHVNADIVILGEGPQEQFLKHKAADLTLSNIHFIGALDDIHKTALLALCQALIMPSHLRSEAFGVSLVEAAMYGKPMISCEIGTGTSYINVDTVTGFVVPPEQPIALAEAMNKIVVNAEMRDRFGVNAYERYKEIFTAQKMMQSYLGIYKRVVAKPVDETV